MSHREVEKTINSLIKNAGMESILHHLILASSGNEPYIKQLCEDLKNTLTNYQQRNQ